MPTVSVVAVTNKRDGQHEITQAAIPPGLSAYVVDKLAGWTPIGPRSRFPGVTENRALPRVLEGDGPTT